MTRQGRGLQVKIQRIAMIIGGELAMRSVAQYLAIDLAREDRGAQPAPGLRSPVLWKQQTGHEQRGCFPDQVRVGTRVRRQVTTDVVQLRKQRPANVPGRSFVQSIRRKQEEKRP